MTGNPSPPAGDQRRAAARRVLLTGYVLAFGVAISAGVLDLAHPWRVIAAAIATVFALALLANARGTGRVLWAVCAGFTLLRFLGSLLHTRAVSGVDPADLLYLPAGIALGIILWLTEPGLSTRDTDLRSRAAITGADNTRAHLGRDLHDDTIQNLGHILRALHTQTTNPAELRTVIDDTAAAIDDQINALRDLIADLNPVTLTQLGLPAAVETLRDRAEQHPDAPHITLTTTPDAAHWPRLPPDVERTCYRVIQEALTNSLRHAAATHTTIGLTLDQDERIVEFVVIDDGTGFTVDPHTTGHGLANITTRIHLAHGHLTINGTHGTRITAQIPTHPRTTIWRRITGQK